VFDTSATTSRAGTRQRVAAFYLPNFMFSRNLRPNFRLYIGDGHNNKQTKRAVSNSPSTKLKRRKGN
jgi:hypothetical protein